MSSWLGPLYRVLAFVFLAWRLGEALIGGVGVMVSPSDIIGLGGEVGVWGVIRLLLDFGFLLLVIGRWDTPWVLPVTGGWVAVSLVAQEGKWCSTLTTFQQVLPFLSGVLLGSYLLVLLFRHVGMRGRILLVCLLTSALPLGFLTVAMFRQADQLITDYFQPIGESRIAGEALRLDRKLTRQISSALRSLLGITLQTRQVLPLEPAALQERALAAGIPVREAFTGPTPEGLSIQFKSIALDKLAALVARRQGLGFLDLSTRAASVPISIKANDIELDDLLERLNLNRQVALRLEAGQLVLEDRETPVPTAPARTLTITHQQAETRLGSDAAPLGRVRLRQPEGRLEMRIDLAAAAGSDPLHLVIDLQAWLPALLVKADPTAERADGAGLLAVQPFAGRLLPAVFQGFTLKQGDSVRPLAWNPADLAVEAGARALPLLARDPDASGLAAGRDPIRLRRYSSSYQVVLDPQGERWLVEAWFLAGVRAPVILALPARAIRPQQARPLALGILVLVVAALMSVLYSERLSRPIQAITAAARRIKDGDLATRIPVEPDQTEIRELGETLVLMADKLTGRIESANRRLAEEKLRFETLVESTWEGIFLIDGAGVIACANHAGRQLLEASPAEPCFCRAFRALGTGFATPLPDRLDPSLAEFKTVFTLPMKQGGGPRIFSLYLRSCQAPGPAAGNGAAPSPGFIAVCRDITIEKEIDRMKTDFVSQVSHELRTPLTSIQAYTEMLLDGEAESAGEQKDYLRIIFDESERLTRLINDLLDIARIESGRRVIKPVPLDLAALARNVATVLAGMAEGKRVTIGVQVPEVPVRITGDADLIKQVGLNLLSNAIKYTAAGGHADVIVAIEADGRPIWSFRDTGIGLTPKDRDRLFTKFFRADSDAVRAAGGTGLGLVLVKQIVEAHQAEITVDSTYGQGSTFTVRFRAGASA